MSLHANLGFKNNPFSKRSSEQELGFIENIFYEPNYYSALLSDLSSGDTRFIIGQRGHGKSSIINKLFNDLEIEERNLVIKIDRFDNIPLKNNEIDFLLLITREIVTKLSLNLSGNRKLVNKLKKSDKEKLSFFILTFFRSISDSEYEDVLNRIKKHKRINFFKRIFNLFGIDIANALTSSAVNVTSNFIRQSIGIDSINNNELYKEYFKKITIEEHKKNDLNSSNCNKSELKKILDEIFIVFKELGYKKIIVLFDKIDEYQDLNQDVTAISLFTKEILSDSEFLLNDNIAIGFSLWSELKSELAGNVRFDKFGTIDVRWSDINLQPLMEKRLSYYSSGIKITLRHLLRDEFDISTVIKLANKSPRDFIFLLPEIYTQQSNKNNDVSFFDSDSIRKGMISFCKTYDYDSLYPSKVAKNKEIKAMINRLLQMKKNRFTKKDITTFYNQTASQSDGQIKIMINYSLIREEEIDFEDSKIYEIIDPKVDFLIEHLVEKIE